MPREQELVDKPLAVVTPVQHSILQIGSNVDKADVISVLVVDTEEKLTGLKNRIGKQISDTNAFVKLCNDNLQNHAHAAIKAYDLTEYQALAKHLKDLGFGVYETAVEPSSIDLSINHIDAEIKVCLKNGGSYGSGPRKAIRIPFNADIKATIRDMNKAHKDLENLSKQLAHVHRNLADIPKLERKAKAALAKQALEKTAEGREILETFKKMGADAIPQLLLPAD